MSLLLDPDDPPSRGVPALHSLSLVAPIDPAEALAERLAQDLVMAWRAGRRLSVEEILGRHPEVRDHPPAAVRLIYEELCLRQESGEDGVSTELLDRFPRYRDELCVLLEGHRLLASSPCAIAFPRVGEVFEGATLLAELGRGGAGRVFLATQADLGNRPVVLKVTPRLGDEHLALARLQHTHIAPLYATRDLPDAGLRVLCMPYLGHTTLARILEELRGRPPGARSGADVVAVIEMSQGASPVSLPPRGPGIDWLARASYEQAICWIGGCLARALHHGHERGLVHLDVKPSNLLLAADGTPMLLDYHLARGPIRPQQRPGDGLIGGTPSYMSPEQADALGDIRAGREVVAIIDGRSDVYSLGVVLYEALGGAAREASEASARRLPRVNPNVSPGLADLLARCLARDPRRRYADALALADDLRRHLADLPLRGVFNRSPRERWSKWRRRRPHAASLVAMGLAVAAAVALVAISSVNRWGQRLRDAEAALALAGGEGRPGPGAVPALEHALDLARTTPGGDNLARSLAARLHLARRIEVAERLGRIADRLRLEHAAGPREPAEMRALDAACREVWDRRGQLLGDPEVPLPDGIGRKVRDDLLDLAILSADLGVHLAPPEAAGPARMEALRRLDEAEASLGPCAALEGERRALAEALGLEDLARAADLRASAYRPESAGDYYGLGLSLLRRGELEPAAVALERACTLRPQEFWPNFHRGLCAARLGQYADAVEALSVCIALAPESAPCYAHRALTHETLGHIDRAERDLDRALELDPRLSGAWTSRGLLKLRAGRPREAISDLRRALDIGGDAGQVHYNLALAHLALGDRERARSSAQDALRSNPSHTSARSLIDELDARSLIDELDDASR